MIFRLAKTSLRVLLVLISFILLLYLSMRGNALVNCQTTCHAVITLFWFEPILALLSAMYLSGEFWSLAVNQRQNWAFDDQTLPPYDAKWQETWHPPQVVYEIQYS